MRIIVSINIIWTICLFLLNYMRYKDRQIIHVWWHTLFIFLTTVTLPIITIIIIYLLESYNNLFNLLTYVLLIVFGLDFVSLLMETFYLYSKKNHPNLKFIYVLLFTVFIPICLAIIAFGFQDLIYNDSHYYKYKLLGLILVLFIVMFDTSKYYSNHYVYELTNNCKLNKEYMINEKKYSLAFFETSIKDISAIYILVLTLINKNLNTMFHFNFELHIIKIKNTLSPNTLNFDSAALFVFSISLIIFVFVDVCVRYAIRYYYKYTGDLN